jgi:hypothetical protein
MDYQNYLLLILVFVGALIVFVKILKSLLKGVLSVAVIVGLIYFVLKYLGKI